MIIVIIWLLCGIVSGIVFLYWMFREAEILTIEKLIEAIFIFVVATAFGFVGLLFIIFGVIAYSGILDKVIWEKKK